MTPEQKQRAVELQQETVDGRPTRHVAYGATHKQPITGVLYKQIDGIWYAWSTIEDEPKRWIKSLGTVEKYLEPIQPVTAPTPHELPTDAALESAVEAVGDHWIRDGLREVIAEVKGK